MACPQRAGRCKGGLELLRSPPGPASVLLGPLGPVLVWVEIVIVVL